MVNWQTSFEVNKLRQEVNEKEEKIGQLLTELRRKENEGLIDIDSLRTRIATLEKENLELKVGSFPCCMMYIYEFG